MVILLIDENYLIIVGSRNRSDEDSQKFQLGPFVHSESSNKTNHCLQISYFVYGKGFGRITINSNKTNDNNDSFILDEKDQSKFF